jgi:alkanesulfonate monooxygenase SsuD/methylene tetrahydromethanopterin reductase-like flavin-dependent oxidoreductase (luciferase family)
MVGGVHYRNPGLWVKAATTLDVLSGGRAWLGIGAAWNEAESRGLGFPWPNTAERFEMLEDTLRIAHGMWQGERGSEEDFVGRQFHATRLLNVPQSISRPRVPILIGGGGERKTLRLVAQYADASNMFGGPDQLLPKYAILAQHCAAVGRDFDEIERTNMQGVGIGSAGAWSQAPESPDAIVERFGRLAEVGVQHVILNFAEANDPALIELLGSKVLPQLRDVEAADPRRLAAVG